MNAPFVGRAAELDLLAAGLERARSDLPSCALVEGVVGSGKSALIRAFTQRLDDVAVLRASGDEAETTYPYGLLEQLITEMPPQIDGKKWRTGDPLLTGAKFLQLLGDAQEGGPVVLVLDDMHLSDRQSLAALTFALRRLRSEKVFVVMATRPDWAAQLPTGLARLLTEPDSRMRLSGLTTAEVSALSCEVGFGSLTFKAADRLREHCQGNPLHLRALMADLSVATVESMELPLPAPRSFAVMVLGALSQTSGGARRLAACAAVLGQRAPFGAVAQVARLDDPLAAVEELQRLRILELVEHEHAVHVTFLHPLVRAAVYDDLGAGTRARLHMAAASTRSGTAALHHRVAAAIAPDPALVQALAAEATGACGRGHW